MFINFSNQNIRDFALNVVNCSRSAIYYLSHAQFKAYLPSAPNIVSWKVQFECDTLKHKQWEINQVSVHCTLVTESCSVNMAYVFKGNQNVRYIIPYYYGWHCKINHPQAVHDVHLHVAGTCLFFLLSKGDCSCLRLINEP